MSAVSSAVAAGGLSQWRAATEATGTVPTL